MKSRALFFGFALILSINLHAQIERGALICRLEGEDFTLNLNGERSIYRQDAFKDGGIVLESSGIVHTGSGVFLEIVLVSTGTLIKLSENSSLVYNGINEAEKFEDLGLLYGRMRVLSGGRTNFVVLRSGGISAYLNAKPDGGDFALEYLMTPGGYNSVPRPYFNIHAIRGSAEVTSANTIIVNQSESLFLDISSFHTFVEKKAIPIDIITYWSSHGFAASTLHYLKPVGDS